jgi:hypothetical protein
MNNNNQEEQIVWVIGGCTYDDPFLHSIWADPLKAIEAAKKLQETAEDGYYYEPEPVVLNRDPGTSEGWNVLTVPIYGISCNGKHTYCSSLNIPKYYHWFNHNFEVDILKDTNLVVKVSSSESFEHLESLMPQTINKTTIRFLNEDFSYIKNGKYYILTKDLQQYELEYDRYLDNRKEGQLFLNSIK